MTYIPRNIPNPLQRDGTSQSQRLLEALKPDSVKIDEKGIDTWLNYANKYAKLLRFYNLDNAEQGDWTEFFEQDISALISLMSETHPREIKKSFLAKLDQLTSGQNDANEQCIAEILAFLQNYANTIHQWLQQSTHTFEGIPELLIQSELKRLIPSIVNDGFTRIIAYLKRAEQLEISFREVPHGMFHIHLLEEQWPFTPILGKFTPLPSGIPITENDIQTEISLLTPLFNRFYEVHLNLYQQSENLLTNSLEDFPVHQPHIALFIACLQVFQTNQEHLNTLTKSHLDFYYEEVLKLKQAPEIADKVHLVFELAQNFFEQKIEEDRRFLAGTDDTGEDLIYASDAEIVVNNAQLDEEIGLKTVFIHKEYEGESRTKYEIINIHAAVDADSEDGLGEELLSEEGKWETFGNERMPYGEIGFAIASPMFLLGEGERKIKIILTLKDFNQIDNKNSETLIRTELRNNIQISFSGEEGWIDTDITSVDIVQKNNAKHVDLIFNIDLSSEEPAISPYSEDVLQAGFATQFPVARFTLDNQGLDTSGDFDLSLKGNIEKFDSSQPYIRNDFAYISLDVGVINTLSLSFLEDQRIYFKSKALIVGIDPQEEAAVWTKLDLENVISYSNAPNPVPEGLVVSHGGKKYLSNAEFPRTSNNSPQNNNLLKIWKKPSESKGVFDPTEEYDHGDLVRVENCLFKAEPGIGNTVNAIHPSLLTTVWKELTNLEGVVQFPITVAEVVEGQPILENNVIYIPYKDKLDADLKVTKVEIDTESEENLNIYKPENSPIIWNEVIIFDAATTVEFKKMNLTLFLIVLQVLIKFGF